MADDRSGPGPAGSGEVHDDDELADVLAAELQRYATGAVPVVGATRPVPPLPPAARPVEPPAEPRRPRVTASPSAAGGPAPSSSVVPPSTTAFPSPAAARSADAGPPAPARPSPLDGDAPRRAGRAPSDPVERSDAAAPLERPSSPPAAGPEPGGTPAAFDRRAQHRAPAPQEPPSASLLPSGEIELPVRRRSGFQPVVPVDAPPQEPIDRVLPTGPVALPEATASLLSEMIADSGDVAGARSARHAAARTSAGAAALESLRGTGPLAVPNGLYADWERSLRSIGRPRAPWDDPADATAVHAPVDAPTEALRLPRDAAPEPDPEPELRSEPAEAARTVRGRRGRRAGVEPAPERAPGAERAEPLSEQLSPALFEGGDDDGVDDVATGVPRISAATTGAIDLPSVEPRRGTGPLLIERVRTAILQLPVVPDSPTGSGAAAVVGRWAGAFASPVLLLLAFGLAAAGAGAAGAAAAVVAVLVLLPAAVRSGIWNLEASGSEEAALLGRRGGAVAAVVLLLVRIAAVALVLFATSSLVAAWAARTGALGGSSSTAGIAAAGGVGLVALLLALLPVRALGVLVQVVGLLGVVGLVLLLLLLAPTADPSVAAAPSGVAAGALGGAAVGLVLLLAGGDLVRWPTALPTAVSVAVATVLAGLIGVVVLLGGLAVAAGSTGDPADALAGALSDGSAADLATPLAVVLLVGAVVLPTLLVRSAGGAAVRLLGGGSALLGTAAAGLLGVAGALGLVAAGVAPVDAALPALGFAGAPLAAWAGVRTLAVPGAPRARVAASIAALGAVVGWAAAAAGVLLPTAAPPTGAGLLAAFVLGLVGGGLARGGAPVRAAALPGDTVDG